MPKAKQGTMCYLFNCDHRHGNYCCSGCKKPCDNRCHNTPQKCGYAHDKEDKNNV